MWRCSLGTWWKYGVQERGQGKDKSQGRKLKREALRGQEEPRGCNIRKMVAKESFQKKRVRSGVIYWIDPSWGMGIGSSDLDSHRVFKLQEACRPLDGALRGQHGARPCFLGLPSA